MQKGVKLQRKCRTLKTQILVHFFTLQKALGKDVTNRKESPIMCRSENTWELKQNVFHHNIGTAQIQKAITLFDNLTTGATLQLAFGF